MVENGRFGGACRAHVVMAGDGVQQLGGRAELLERPQPEVYVAEQPPFLRGREDRRPPQLARAADVVDERGGEEQVGAEALMDLRELAAERRDSDGVLQQAAGVGVVTDRRRRIRAQRRVRERP